VHLAGADEAGKGPVLGPLVVAATSMDEDRLLPDFRDSKQVAPKRREELADNIRELGEVAIAIKEPGEIDERGIDTVLREGYVETLSSLRFDEAYADAADVSAERFQKFLRRNVRPEIKAEHGADENRRIVAAASIVAKVERDRLVEEIAETYGEVGSGYPADPETRNFLENYVENNGELPGCARRTWSTSRKLLAEKDQTGLTDF